MKELVDFDLFDQVSQADAICIPTNCSIVFREDKPDPMNPMGGGCAGQAARRWKEIEAWYAERILVSGHVPNIIGFINQEKPEVIYSPLEFIPEESKSECALVAYPTMHTIMEPASLPLVIRSAALLVEMADYNGWKDVYLAAPGIGIGGLEWEQVRQSLQIILDDRFTVMRTSPKTGFIKFGDLN